MIARAGKGADQIKTPWDLGPWKDLFTKKSSKEYHSDQSHIRKGNPMNQLGLHKVITLVAIVVFILAPIACGSSKVEGTYTNATGLATLDLSSGGKASLTLMGDTKSCTYQVDSKTVKVDCMGDKLDFPIHEDGSLAGPGFIGAMKKSKP